MCPRAARRSNCANGGLSHPNGAPAFFQPGGCVHMAVDVEKEEGGGGGGWRKGGSTRHELELDGGLEGEGACLEPQRLVVPEEMGYEDEELTRSYDVRLRRRDMRMRRLDVSSGAAFLHVHDRTPSQKQEDAALATRLAVLIEDANERVGPLTRLIRSHIETMESRPEGERNEQELVSAVKPLLLQASQILDQTQGAIKGADPDNRVSSRAKRRAAQHEAGPEEQRLAAALKVMVEDVGGTIEWARNKLDAFPKAKRDLGPLLDALGQPLTQIVGGVGLLLAGVLNLVGKLLSGLGLDGLLKGLVAATGLDKIYKGLGLGKLYG
ncbi:hypothetical protein BDW22DRAFT_1418359 [Trametopsis cervina]|nr:hypothetical protein BDW22DRAFT_1418359 [Trametopsis cervina]